MRQSAFASRVFDPKRELALFDCRYDLFGGTGSQAKQSQEGPSNALQLLLIPSECDTARTACLEILTLTMVKATRVINVPEVSAA